MKTRAPAVLTALAVTLLSAAIGNAATGTTVDSVSASRSGGSINVSGTATFGTQDAVEVGFDGTGDSTISQGVGLDIERMLIQRASGATNNLLFTLDLDGLQGGGIPEGFQYNWDITVDGGSAEGGDEWSIKFMRSGQGVQVGTAAWAYLYRCVRDATTGNFTCTRQAPALAVTFDEAGGQVRVTVPLSRIGGASGSTIGAWPRNGDPVWVRPSASGAQTPGVTVDGASHDDYIVPGNTVQLGIAPAGTAEQFVNYSGTATVTGSSFAGTLPAGSSGTYDVWARACFGDNCAAQKTTITI